MISQSDEMLLAKICLEGEAARKGLTLTEKEIKTALGKYRESEGDDVERFKSALLSIPRLKTLSEGG